MMLKKDITRIASEISTHISENVDMAPKLNNKIFEWICPRCGNFNAHITEMIPFHDDKLWGYAIIVDCECEDYKQAYIFTEWKGSVRIGVIPVKEIYEVNDEEVNGDAE